MPDACPPEHSANIAKALERANAAQRDIGRVEESLTDSIAALREEVRTEMRAGFSALTVKFDDLALKNANRSGAEKLGAWLIGSLGVFGTVAAAIWAAISNSGHH